MATLGIAIYDHWNSELYNALSDRAKRIEDRLGLKHGQFRSRPLRGKRLFGLFQLAARGATPRISAPGAMAADGILSAV